MSSATASLTVRGDGATALMATSGETDAVSISAEATAFTKTVVAVSTTKAAAADFFLLRVGVAAGGSVGFTGVAACGWAHCGGCAGGGLTGWQAARFPGRLRVLR